MKCFCGDGNGSVGGIVGWLGGCVEMLQRSSSNTKTISYLVVFVCLSGPGFGGILLISGYFVVILGQTICDLLTLFHTFF